jgi:hypothetical protein
VPETTVRGPVPATATQAARFPVTTGVIRSQVHAAIQDWFDNDDENYRLGIDITDNVMHVVGPALEQVAAHAAAAERAAIHERLREIVIRAVGYGNDHVLSELLKAMRELVPLDGAESHGVPRDRPAGARQRPADRRPGVPDRR